MIKISSDHKEYLYNLLEEYTEADYEKTIKNSVDIFKEYYQCDPNRIGKRLLNKLFKTWKNKTNEAIVHYWTICKLIFEYQYPIEQIDLEVPCGNIGRKVLDKDSYGVAHADIVVYTHESRRPGSALIAIECREYGGLDGVKQAASYSRALQSKYHLFTDSDKWEVYETLPHPLDGTLIGDIPIWIGYRPLAKRLSKEHRLPPLTDEKQLRDLVTVCHNSIHSEGIDPAKAFDELVKLFFVKVFDEQEIPDYYEFSVLSGETEEETGKHVRELLKKAKETSRYKELFSDPGDSEFGISNKSILKVVKTFQGFSFTGNSVVGIDAKGTVYENMVGATFRGELGQYFTPRKIVEFMVDLLSPSRNDYILDPACGSGGFLIYAMRKVASQIRLQQKNLPVHLVEKLIHDYVNNNIFGIDISPRMVRAARMNMIMHGDGWSGIQRCHGLKMQSQQRLNGLVGKFTIVLSNPPFAGFETEENVLKEYDTGRNEAGFTRGVNRAIIFIEQIINLLAEDGKAGIVIPRSIFENESYSFRRIRQIIFERCEILALIGLPRTAFHHTDCGILGDLLFIKRVSKPRKDYDVFVGWAQNVGYNTLGHNIEENDFAQILVSYNKRNKENLFPIQLLIKNDNINPWHYHVEATQLRNTIETRSNLVPLSELVSVYNNRISRKILKQTPERTLRYVEVGDFDPVKGTFTYTEHKIGSLPSRATYEMNGEELILLPNAKNSLESRRTIIRIGEEVKGLIMTNRFLPLRARVNPEYLVMILNTDFVRNQLIAICRGAGAPDFRENKLNEVMIPLPKSNDISSIDSYMEEISNKLAIINKLECDLKKLQDEIKDSLNGLAK
ncbi:MAG: N-6 DNA methylase [Nitrospirae bacterium]|nr:N-6 DNA methylase [Nitrospirota bacterium]